MPPNKKLSQPYYDFLDKNTAKIFLMDTSQLSSGHVKAPLEEVVTHDGGKTWKKQTFTNIQDWGIEDITFVNNQTGWLYTSSNGMGVSPSKIYKTTDGGLSWQQVKGIKSQQPQPDWLSSNKGNVLWSMGMTTVSRTDALDSTTTKILKSVDGGYNWTSLSLIKSNPKESIEFQRPTFFGSGGVLVGVQYPKGKTSGTAHLTIFRLNPASHNWVQYGSFKFSYKNNQMYPYPFFNKNNVNIQFQDVNHGWLYTGNHVYVTTDGGKSWTELKNNGSFPANFQFVSNSTGFGFNELGFFQSNNGGKTWTSLSKKH